MAQYHYTVYKFQGEMNRDRDITSINLFLLVLAACCDFLLLKSSDTNFPQ